MEQKAVVILDGGTGTSLLNRGHTEISECPVWSALAIKSNSSALVNLHKDFFYSGSDVVLSATYQASTEGFMKCLGITSSEANDLITKGVILAKQARSEAEEETGRHGIVAGSVGPYGATLCDMSEYHGRYAEKMSLHELSTWHSIRLSAIINGGPDLLAVETIPVLKEAEAILMSLTDFPGVKAYISFQCNGEHCTSHGEHLSDAIRTMMQSDCVVAVGVNCTHSRYITPLLKSISHLDISCPLLVKPNNCPNDRISRVSETSLSFMAQEWLHHGASWLGGCCCYEPHHIAELRKNLQHQPYVFLPGIKL